MRRAGQVRPSQAGSAGKGPDETPAIETESGRALAVTCPEKKLAGQLLFCPFKGGGVGSGIAWVCISTTFAALGPQALRGAGLTARLLAEAREPLQSRKGRTLTPQERGARSEAQAQRAARPQSRGPG